ncbi:MAG TPA: VOC family protein [Terracidiphilus sp.]|jgi:catechol 2,3-dioxygenase-like lactoylglutathione lyase family enzyme
MANLNFINLYVDDAQRSADFYATILGKQPVQSSPGFSMFILNGGLTLGMWKREAVEPAVEGAAGGGEICFAESSDAQVDERFAEWTGQGLVIAQKPTKMSFGYTFTALDPDGHRLRVYTLAQ